MIFYVVPKKSYVIPRTFITVRTLIGHSRVRKSKYCIIDLTEFVDNLIFIDYWVLANKNIIFKSILVWCQHWIDWESSIWKLYNWRCHSLMVCFGSWTSSSSGEFDTCWSWRKSYDKEQVYRARVYRVIPVRVSHLKL